jgi:hypothetical protein
MIPIIPEDRKVTPQEREVAHKLLDQLLDGDLKSNMIYWEQIWFDDNQYIPWRKPHRTRFTISATINQIE